MPGFLEISGVDPQVKKAHADLKDEESLNGGSQISNSCFKSRK